MYKYHTAALYKLLLHKLVLSLLYTAYGFIGLGKSWHNRIIIIIIILACYHIIVIGSSHLQLIGTGQPLCPGSILTLECTVNGSNGEVTVWRGDAFDCEEITLLHSDSLMKKNHYGNSVGKACNNGTITAQLESSNTSNPRLYVSQLNVVITSDMNGTNIVCMYDNGTASTHVGEYVIIFSEAVACTNISTHQLQNDTNGK